MEVDLIINAKWVIPVVPQGQLLEDHSIAIKDKRIIDICSAKLAAEQYSAAQITDLPEHAVIPGLVNAHGHAPMVLLRGTADDIPLKQWLEEKIWPLEGKLVDREFVFDGATLAIAEMIRSGTTCFADMYFFPDEVARAAVNSHIRVQLASPVLDFPTVWAQDADEYILKATQLHDDFRQNELVSTAFGPHAPYTVSDAPLQKLAVLAEELDVPIHMHVHETASEIEEALAKDGRRPLRRLLDLGLITPRLNCIHATQLLAEEIQLLAQHGATVLHCPESNMKLASGFCQVAELFNAGVNVGLGTDGGASNNDLDMFTEMRTAALMAKAVSNDATAVPAQQALEMATINSAKALGLDGDIGSLEVGKFADITAISFSGLNSLPVNNPLSHIVYAIQACQVSHVWCSGTKILEHGQLKTLDIDKIAINAADWHSKVEMAL
ncbi:MAG: TRZ/ATZ family hydrolase [Gammaproteobacteria bacterium]|nr:TRZ/ATZ family hydrolase [Gammaproteobacteria bacterium]MDD9958177.1 TRZ/ATZ family hydrolase [Gammaproteobacteria bacterium]